MVNHIKIILNQIFTYTFWKENFKKQIWINMNDKYHKKKIITDNYIVIKSEQN